MSTLLKASVVVVTWNGLHHLKQCLPALLRQRAISYEVILVDNGSTDGSVEWVARSYPDVVLVELGSNQGFAAANNAGFTHARTELIATLNNDAQPDPDWLASLVHAADAHPEAGSFASRVVLTNNPNILDSTGITTDVLGIAWNRHSTDPVGSESEGEVFGACAAAALYRKHLLETLPILQTCHQWQFNTGLPFAMQAISRPQMSYSISLMVVTTALIKPCSP